jgi:hypothetical protein
MRARVDAGVVTQANERAAEKPSRADPPSWPGRLVDRALATLSADYQRPTGPIVIAGLLAVGCSGSRWPRSRSQRPCRWP